MYLWQWLIFCRCGRRELCASVGPKKSAGFWDGATVRGSEWWCCVGKGKKCRRVIPSCQIHITRHLGEGITGCSVLVASFWDHVLIVVIFTLSPLPLQLWGSLWKWSIGRARCSRRVRDRAILHRFVMGSMGLRILSKWSAVFVLGPLISLLEPECF